MDVARITQPFKISDYIIYYKIGDIECTRLKESSKSCKDNYYRILIPQAVQLRDIEWLVV